MRAPAVRLAIVAALIVCMVTGCSSPTAIFGEGFYAEEPSLDGSTFRWMGATGTIALEPSKTEMVLDISLIVPLDQLPAPPTVTILLNERVLEQIAVTDKGVTKRYAIPLENAANNPQLRIQTSQTFMPAERDTSSQDRRKLGLIVSRVEWTPKQ